MYYLKKKLKKNIYKKKPSQAMLGLISQTQQNKATAHARTCKARPEFKCGPLFKKKFDETSDVSSTLIIKKKRCVTYISRRRITLETQNLANVVAGKIRFFVFSI
jgi:hypothetical protein